MFDVNDLGGEEVFVAEQEVISTAATTVITKELTFAQALKALKTLKPKVKGIVIQEQEEPSIDAIPLAVKSSKIVGWKIYKKGKKSYYHIIRADGKTKMYMVFSRMLESLNREDLEDLYKLVTAKFKSTRPMEDLDLLLWWSSGYDWRCDGGSAVESAERIVFTSEQIDGEAMIYSIQNGDHPLPIVAQIVQICLWIIDSGCSKHMTGNRALLTNFVEKFLGTVRFGNNDFVVIVGYGDGFEVAFRKSTCFVRNKDGVDFLIDDRSSNLYTIALNEVASNSSTCLLAKASSSQSWLWHQRLSHLNFATINNLVKNNLVQDCKKAKVKVYNYYKTKMLLAEKDNDEQVLLAEDQAWIESSSDSDQEINANMVFMAQIEKVLSDLDESSSSAEETIAEVAYYTSESESEYEFETSEYYDNSTNYGLFMNNGDDQEVFHDAIESASENFNENHIDSQKYCDESEVDHNNSEAKDHLVDKLNRKFNHKITKCQKRIEKANQQSKVLENKNKDLQDKYDVLINQVNDFEEKNNEFNEQMKVLNEKNADMLAEMEVLNEQLKDNDKQHRKKIREQEILFDKMSRQVVEMNNNVLRLQENSLEKEMKLSEMEGCRYVLVVVDDYSRYTWVFFLHSKDEASDVIISFIKKTQVNLQIQVQRVRTDNGTEFKNKTLAKFFDEVGIFQHFSAARTMLTFANLPLFLWAKAITTACFTQNRSIIHKRFDKTPYELMNKRKPNIKFFRVFGCRCYLLNDYEDVGKLKAKGDIRVFVGYSKQFAAFKIYNKRTRKIHESMNVNFDEISKMASKQFSLEPDLSNLNKMGKSFNLSVSQVSDSSKKDLEDLFHNFYDEYFDSSNIMKSSTTNVETSNVEIPSQEEEVFHKISESFQEKSSSFSLDRNIQQSSEEVGDAYFEASTSFHDSSNVYTFYQPYPHEKKWTKGHPLHKIIGDPKSSIRTRGQLANSCLFSCLLSFIEPANVAKALRDADRVSAMQEELDQFAILKVWRLVPRPEGKTIIKTKWIFKNKKDENSLVIQNKARLVAVGYSQQEGIDYDETFAPVA
uniref:Integrase catalytic domain-containing protein n=1 Tax=Tanacetum cinerariifolium TaxID=118510 RepID=A0A6L2NU76_TANCI|nr:hypothetical protein [Tanacetum cinerariifolium]